MLIPKACLSGLLFGSEVEFGVEPVNGKSYSNDIKNQSQFVLITKASIFPLFPKEQGEGRRQSGLEEKKRKLKKDRERKAFKILSHINIKKKPTYCLVTTYMCT